jgi:tetratricopeptide (TPR) repeat protein
MASPVPADLLDSIPDADLEALVQSIKDGAATPGESLGFGPEALTSIERMALGYYRGKKYGQAAVLYSFVLRMDPDRAGAWRGLGACCQAQKLYAVAARCYEAAVRCDPKDIVSQVFWGECLCQTGQTQAGLTLLREVLKTGTSEARYKPYLTRASAIVGAEGGVPPKLVLLQAGKKMIAEAAELANDDPNREITARDIQNNPKLAGMLREIGELVAKGRLSYAELGGFTKNELDGAYGSACEYAQMGRVAEAIQIAGYLALVDPQNGRYYQLTGICWQRMKQYEAADHYYGMSLIFDKENARTLCYQGECRLMLGKVEEGLDLLARGVKAAGPKKDLADVASRGQALLAQFKR